MMKNRDTATLKEIFTLVPGLASSYVERVKKPLSENYIPYIRPSHRQYSSIDAYVNKKLIPAEKIFPAHTLYVSTDGQGSHTYAYVSVCEFVANSNVTVLIPKRTMTLGEKLFYAQCITDNRYKFSYGRKPKGIRLETIVLPRTVPDPVQKFSVAATIESLLGANLLLKEEIYTYPDETGASLPLKELFLIQNGISSNEAETRKNRVNQSWIPLVRPSNRQNTSVVSYVNKKAVPEEKIFPPGTLYISTNGQGSHTFSYVAPFEFVPNSDVSVLIPKRQMSIQEKLFYAQCITSNRYKFSYGRKPKGERLSTILLPEYPPSYVLQYNLERVMEDFRSILDSKIHSSPKT
ncbi:MAG: hypothetical protein HFE83_04185 [Lachnospiraceae bacterium]|nr:hypothetical protein [Lachnospiraceae bacterium]